MIEQANRQKGLILVTGVSGSGKSTTLACMIDRINSTRREHIITLEDPIEYLHSHKMSIVSQREISLDTESYHTALRAVLRQSPNVLLLGEMRDTETIETALTASETGHLVISSLHTVGAANSVDRIIDAFPAEKQHQARLQLSMVLCAVVSQQLVTTTDGGILPAFELMVCNSAVRNMIRESKTHMMIPPLWRGRRWNDLNGKFAAGAFAQRPHNRRDRRGIRALARSDGEENTIIRKAKSMRDIAVVLSNDNKNTAPFETADAIKKAGFKNVFVQWYNKDWHPTQLQQLDYVRSRGLKVIFAHLGYQNINALWEEGDDGDALTVRFLDDIYDCYAEDLNLLVMHLTSKSEAPAYGEIGLERIQKLADYAATLGVKLALENTKIPGYQEYVIQNISNKNLGICYDAGHCHAHFGDKFDFSIFKDRIFAVHLHDNDGTADQHLIPV